MDPRVGERYSGIDKSFWPKRTDLASSPEYSLPVLPQLFYQWDTVQAQEELKKETKTHLGL